MNEWILTEDGTLCHHGILGQRWGHRNGPPYPLNESQFSVAEKRGVRRYQNYDGSRIGEAKSNLKSAKQQYSIDYNNAYIYSARHPISQYIKGTKAHDESTARWKKAADSAEKVNKAQSDYKQAKSDYKQGKTDSAEKVNKAQSDYDSAEKVNKAQSDYDSAEKVNKALSDYEKTYEAEKQKRIEELTKFMIETRGQEWVDNYNKTKKEKFATKYAMLPEADDEDFIWLLEEN